MKKILSIFALFVALGVKAQVVGGYIPINSTKSATMGGLRVNGAITATGTIKTGSTTITGGGNATVTLPASSGTLANLGDAVFALNLAGGLTQGNGNPADGVVLYHTNLANAYTQQGAGKIYMPYNVTLVGWSYTGYITSVASSAESSTLAINIDNVATNLNTSITYSVGGGVNTYSGTATTTVNAGSYIEAKLSNPTWVTNPQGLLSAVTFFFVRRQ